MAEKYAGILKSGPAMPTPADAGRPEFYKLLDELRELYRTKNGDYSDGDHPLSNYRGSADLGVPPWIAAMVRAKDKMSRIETFTRRGSLSHESVEDSMKDLAVHALIALLLYREDRTGA